MPSVRFKGFLIMKHDRLEIATHEAGHATFRLIIYGTAGRCAVFDAKGGAALGVACGADDDPGQAAREVTDNERDFSHLAGNLQECLNQASLAWAGAAAVALWRGNAHMLPTSGRGNRTDTEHVYEVGRLAFLENDGLLIEAFRLLAYRYSCAILSRRMPAVRAIAEKLVEKGELSESEIGSIYANAITEKKESEGEK
jgi:hypothetical protein